MTRNDLLTLAQRLREYNHNPHHINPTSEAFHNLIAESASAISMLATPPADAADMGGEDGERNRAFKACPNNGCDWGAFYLGWKAKAKDLVSIRAALEAQHRQQAGKLAEALRQVRGYTDSPHVVGIIDEALADWEKTK